MAQARVEAGCLPRQRTAYPARHAQDHGTHAGLQLGGVIPGAEAPVIVGTISLMVTGTASGLSSLRYRRRALRRGNPARPQCKLLRICSRHGQGN